ncbi:MAG: transposase [Deltaproteobacteria bacterium]|nr:transposase [Deltaproteobacteria bacterium]
MMIRGIEGRNIFRDDRDRSNFLERLDELVPELGFHCFGWVLMPNHVHLAVQSGPVRISRLMARLNTGYARAFNLRHQRQGYLFQNRFRSRIIENDADLLGVIAYICRNPLKAGIVSSITELSDWPWSGFSALTGARSARLFESVGATLALFGDAPDVARCNLAQFVAVAEIENTRSAAADPPPAQCGSSSTNKRALNHPTDPATPTTPVPDAKRIQLQELIDSVCQQLRIDPSDLRSRRRTKSLARARASIAYQAVIKHHIAGRQVAKALGVSPSAISHALVRGQTAHPKKPTNLP